MSSPVIRTEGLTKDYGHGRGVFDLDLEVGAGEVMGYLGPNGAGKSTTIRMLLDMVRPTRGRAEVLGADPRHGDPTLRRRITTIPGDFRPWSGWRVREVLEYLAALRGGVDPRRTAALAERLELDLDRHVSQLSKGNRQKIGVVAAFAPRVELLILDEPTSGLDPLLQAEFIRLVREAVADGASVLLSSHVLSEVEHVADHVGIIREGRLVDVLGVAALKARASRTLEVTFDHDVPPGLGALEGVEEVFADQRVARYRISGGISGSPAGGAGTPGAPGNAMDAFVKALAASTVVGLRGEEADLEHIFLRYYGDAPEQVQP